MRGNRGQRVNPGGSGAALHVCTYSRLDPYVGRALDDLLTSRSPRLQILLSTRAFREKHEV